MDTEFHQKAFLLLLTLVTVAFFWVLLPYYGAVFWAAILAIIFRPLQRTLLRRLGERRSLAAFISVIVCILLAVLPVTFIALALLNEGARVLQAVQDASASPPEDLAEAVAQLPPWAQQALERFGLGDLGDVRARLGTFAGAAGQFLAAQALAVGENVLGFVVSLGVMLYVLFFLFRDGLGIGRNIRAALPLSDELSRQLLSRFAAVVRATVKGNIIIAVLQGVIGGLAFWALGVPGALLWTVVMIFASMLPAVGAGLVWAPAAIYLFVIGEPFRAGILVVVGAGVIGLVDNLLRPQLVARDTRLPDYVILVSTLGGLSVFGINGFVIGPLIAALFVTVWTLFSDVQNGRRHAPAGAAPLGSAPPASPSLATAPITSALERPGP